MKKKKEKENPTFTYFWILIPKAVKQINDTYHIQLY